MKKTVALGLAFCLLLTACGKQKVPSSETEKSSASVESASLNTERINEPSAQETEPAKQSKDLHPEMHTQSFGLGDYIETENAIYYNDRFKNRIYFSVDNGSHFYPLCSKANCTHSDENCSASGYGVGYFEGSLYTIRFDSEADVFLVVRISLDGTDQNVIKKIPFPGGGAFPYTYHNGRAFLHYIPSLDSKPLDELKERLFMVDLRTGEITEPLEDLLKDGTRIGTFRFYQNVMTAYTEGTFMENGPEQTRVLYIDMNTWEVREYMQQLSKSVWYIDDSKLYFLSAKNYYIENGIKHYVKKTNLDEGFYEVDIQTGEIIQCLDLTGKDIFRAVYDEDYIYATSIAKDKDDQYHTLYIYNRDYELVEQKELDKYEFLIFVSSDRLYFSREYDYSKIYRYMEKSDIGSGNMPIYDVNQ